MTRHFILILITFNFIFLNLAEDNDKLNAEQCDKYQLYLKSCKNDLNFHFKNLPNELTNLVSEYFCNSYNQWKKKNEELIRFAKTDNIDKITELLASGEVDVNALDSYGDTALIWNVIRQGKKDPIQQNTKIIELLINAGADVNIKDCYGTTALSSAISAKVKNQKIVAILRKAGARRRKPNLKILIPNSNF